MLPSPPRGEFTPRPPPPPPFTPVVSPAFWPRGAVPKPAPANTPLGRRILTPGGGRDALRTHPYDAVVIGSGLRLIPAQTAVFEAVVNTVRTLAPATPLLFNEGPGTNVEALERTFGKRAWATASPLGVDGSKTM